MLTCPSAHSAYPIIHFRIMRTVSSLSQLHINRKLQKYISVSICPCHSVFYKISLIAFKNDDWCHFVVGIGSVAFKSFYCVCIVSFYFSLFSYFFEESTTCWDMEVSLKILIIKQWNCSLVPKWSFEEWVASAFSN